MSDDENIQSQNDELEVLSSIYGNDFNLYEEKKFDIRIVCDTENFWAVTISGLLPNAYPSHDPPLFEIHTECLSEEELAEMYRMLAKKWNDCTGSPILYCWVEKIREMLLEKYELAKLFIETTQEEKEREMEITSLLREEDLKTKAKEFIPQVTHENIPNILSGNTLTVKKSTFQGHAAVVKTLHEMKLVLSKLKENRKVSQATHNIVAYRISGKFENTLIQDYADDGEANAGGRLLHLLQIMDVKDVVVIVSRWYGGILLGPDRFRLISNCARDVVVASGVYTPKLEKSRHRKKK